MTRDELLRAACQDDAVSVKITQKASKEIAEALIRHMCLALENGEDIILHGFGKFKVKDIPERAGRNPATGETITIAAHRVLKFKPTPSLKQAIR